MTRIGVYGGTFDPIHIGHLAAAQETATVLALDSVLFVPNNRPPHKQNRAVSSAEDRLAMVELAIANNQTFRLSAVELGRPGLSYTLDTLRALRADLHAETELFFLTGADALTELHTWSRPDELLDEFGLVVMERPIGSVIDWSALAERFPRIASQVQLVPVPLLEISSADLRRRVADGRPVRYYVPEAVEAYIRSHGLYA